MSYKDFVAVSGLPGLYKLVTTRNNGLVVEDVDTGKTKFLSVRKYQFTPLETVAIYTDDDAEEISEVFSKIETMEPTLPIPENGAKAPELFEYFEQVLPDYDRERVMISDVKKVLKWYKFLKSRELLHGSDEEE